MPPKCTLSAATARKRSGRSSAQCHATGPPQSWPTTTAVSIPHASRSPTMSPTRCSWVYSSTDAGRSVVPYPRWSGARTWYPASPSAFSWWRHEYQHSGKPWHSTTAGPSSGPDSATCMRRPLVSTWRWRSMSVVLLGPVEVGGRVAGEVGTPERRGVGKGEVHVGLLLDADLEGGAPALEHVTARTAVVGQEVQVVARDFHAGSVGR